MPTVVMCVHVLPGEQGCQVIRGELRVKRQVQDAMPTESYGNFGIDMQSGRSCVGL